MRSAPLVTLAVLALAGLPASVSEPAAGSITLSIECFQAPFRAMEFTYSAPTCWNHSGIHTYFLGTDTTYLLRGVQGLAFSVEQQFSAPTEGLEPALWDDVGAPAPEVRTALAVEVSLDGLAWQRAGTGTYGFLPWWWTAGQACTVTGEPCPSFDGLTRQNVLFDLGGQGQEFRFLRVRQPYSQATQGLSGFLDHTRLTVSVDLGVPVPPADLQERRRTLDCARAMEAVSAEHPCWFGGLDRYDSPSYFHTWFLGDARLSRVWFNATVLPWRSDDFFAPLGPFTRAPAPPSGPDDAERFASELVANTQQGVDNHTRKLTTTATLQASADGVAWTDLAVAAGPYGNLTASVDLDGVEAKFVRLVPEKHARYEQFNQFAPNHHPRGFLLGSEVRIEGLLSS